MRSFAVTLFATLAFGAFSWAAPTPKRDNVGLESVLTGVITELTPLTQQLGMFLLLLKSPMLSNNYSEFLNANNSTVEAITPVVNQITTIVGDAAVSVQKLVGLPVDVVLTTVEGVLTTAQVAKLAGDVITVIKMTLCNWSIY